MTLYSREVLKSSRSRMSIRLTMLFLLILLLNILIGLAGHWSTACFGATMLAWIYLATRPQIYYHPANVVFANYAIYFVLPYSLWFIYNLFDIEYILPWGMINDWALLSDQAVISFLWMFFLMYFGSLLLFDEKKLSNSFIKIGYKDKSKGKPKPALWNIFFLINILAVLLFIRLSGGFSAWLNNYSETYLLNRQGLGVLNLYILWTANFSAFALGFVRFVLRRDLPKSTVFLGLVAILLSIFAQGIKSRIPMLLFFYFASYLAARKLKISSGIYIFIALILMFMFGMYFRSDGFYGTPQLLIEYLQSYFNTIFLHDLVLKDFGSGELGSMLMGFNKYLELYYGAISKEVYDLAVFLTQKYYPDQWYVGGGTQQWPIETDLYLTFSSQIFWIIPITIYLLIFSLIYRSSHRAGGYVFFVYCAELIRMMSIFRSGFLPWDLGLTIFSYLFLYLFWRLLFRFGQKSGPPARCEA